MCRCALPQGHWLCGSYKQIDTATDWCVVLLVVLICTPQEAKKLFEEKFKSGKNRWFFTKLRF
jgi:hypothetical protein